jgi:uncharacterized protein with NAD-binding domain and iron-sulfur cluster
MKKQKIAVIGGGLGSLSTVWHLLQQPNAKELYDITIYQMGWRWGGKGASGVNRKVGDRVEEHGIHFWFGFYENAFQMMKTVYRDLKRPPHAALATFKEAFKAQPYMVMTENVDGQWVDWHIDLPPLPGTIGDGHFNNPVEEVLVGVFNYLALEYRNKFGGHNKGCLGGFLGRFMGRSSRPKTAEGLEHIVKKMEADIEKHVAHDIEKHLKITGKLLSNPEYHGPDMVAHQLENLRHLRHWLWDLIGTFVHRNNTLRRLWTATDFCLAMVHGMVKDGVLTKKEGKLHFDFQAINALDYKEWLVQNGADAQYIWDFPPVKSMYDGPFAFYKGNVDAPNVEAGTALNIFLRLAFTCKENVVWRMQAGMGDTIFAPIYQLLKRNFPDNVHCKFFHKATNLKLSDDQKSIAEIEFEKQVRLKDGLSEYPPLYSVTANGKTLDCWPSEPLYEYLDPAQAAALQAGHIDLESSWSGWDQGEKVSIKLGEDFDTVLLGASIAALPYCCTELINANPRWQAMLDHVGTVQTQGFQLWLTKNPQELGVKDSKFLSCYVEPLDTYAEMNQVLARETWKHVELKPQYLLYVCGAFEDAENIPPHSDTHFPQSQKERVFRHTQAFIERDLQHILPGAFDAQGQFDWSILVAPDNLVGPDRLRAQYIRANIDPTERYVYALADSTRYRLRTDESGFANLFLTGDWIQNGFNIGFVEGATVSGIQAARAISGNPNIPIALPW